MDASVRLLGPPAVRVDGAWEPLSPTKPHAVLAYAAYADAPVRRAVIAALLWPEADARHAHAGLRQALLSLRDGRLGALVGADRTRAWVAGAVDVRSFRGAVLERRWRDAVEVHRGALLEGFEIDDASAFGTWLAIERGVVDEGWRRACRALIDEARATGCHDDALELADRLVHADPFDERATRDAMAAAAATGDLHGAHRRYGALATLLAAELGTEPEPATRDLFATLGTLPVPSAPEVRAGPVKRP